MQPGVTSTSASPAAREIFISYKRADPSEEVTVRIEKALTDDGLKVVRDKTSLGFKADIEAFMDRLSAGCAVVCVLSDGYLRSPNCMRELVALMRHDDAPARIFPVVLPNALIYEAAERIRYVQYWQEERSKLNDQIRGLNDQAGLGTTRAEIDLYAEIARQIDFLTGWLKRVNSFDIKEHIDSDFQALREAIKISLNGKLDPADAPGPENAPPVASTPPPPSGHAGQAGAPPGAESRQIMTSLHESDDLLPYEPPEVELLDQLEELTGTRNLSPHEAKRRRGEKDRIVGKLRRRRQPDPEDVVARAKLTKSIPGGAYGRVFEGTDVETGVAVAVKVFDFDKLGQQRALRCFRRGVYAIRKLNQQADLPPTIVRLVRSEPGDFAFSMPFYPNGNLEHIEGRGWTVSKKVEVFRSICEGIAFAHKHEIVHRDIKPANVVLDEGWAPVIIDFDLVDLLSEQMSLTKDKGTHPFKAPEAYQDPEDPLHIPIACDIFSLGRLLQFLLEESVPNVTDDGAPSAELRKHPRGLVRIIRKCTLKSPADRYRTVGALLADLDRYDREPDKVGADWPARNPPKEGAVPTAVLVAGIAVLGSLTGFGITRALGPVEFPANVPIAVKADAAGLPDALPSHEGWSDDNYARIQAMIRRHAGDNSHPVALFDWDNNVIFNDCGDATFFWMVQNGKIRQPPGRDWRKTSPFLSSAGVQALTKACNGLAKPNDLLPTGRPGQSNGACAAALVATYANKLDESNVSWDHHKWNHRRMEPRYAWAAELLEGYTPEEVRDFARAAKKEQVGPRDDTKKMTVGGQSEAANLGVHEEMGSLISDLQTAGFAVWVITASAQYVIEPFAELVNIPADHVIGIRTLMDRAGKLTYTLEGCGGQPTDSMIPYIDGKRCWVNEVVFGAQGPAALDRLGDEKRRAVFASGDTTSDLTFLSDATELRLAIAHHRAELMCVAYNNEDGKWLVNAGFGEKSEQSVFPCSTIGCEDREGKKVPCRDEDGGLISDQTDSVYPAKTVARVGVSK